MEKKTLVVSVSFKIKHHGHAVVATLNVDL